MNSTGNLESVKPSQAGLLKPKLKYAKKNNSPKEAKTEYSEPASFSNQTINQQQSHNLYGLPSQETFSTMNQFNVNTHLSLHHQYPTNPMHQSYPAQSVQMPVMNEQSAKAWQEYLAAAMSSMQKLSNQNSFTSLLRHIADSSTQKNESTANANIYQYLIGLQQNILKKEPVNFVSTSILSSLSSSSSSCSSTNSLNNFNPINQSKDLNKIFHKTEENMELMSPNDTADSAEHNYSNDYSNEDYEDVALKAGTVASSPSDDPYDMPFKSTKTSTPCSASSSPALSYSSFSSLTHKQENLIEDYSCHKALTEPKAFIKFSIDNILGNTLKEESPRNRHGKRKCINYSPDSIKRSKLD